MSVEKGVGREAMSQSPNTAEKPPEKLSLLTAFIFVLVAVHFLAAIAFPVAFIYEWKFLLSETGEIAFNVWLCQPVLIAVCLMISKRESVFRRTLLYIDIGLSVMQKASIFLLYALVGSIIK